MNSNLSSMTNPVIGKMIKKAPILEVNSHMDKASYRGIANKTLFFLLTTVLGIILYFALHNYFLSISPSDFIFDYVDESGIMAVHMSYYEAIAFIVAGFLAVITPLMAWLLRSTIPVTGTLCTMAQGYFIGCISEMLTPDYKWVGILAMVLTVVIVGTMLFLYVKRIVRVTKKFRTIMMVLFPTIIVGGILIAILSVIPGVSQVLEGLNSVMQNPIISILSSVVFIVIAALFLIADFNAVEECVEKGMNKKLEWMAAFGIAYTVIYIYFKVLNLILTIVGKSNDSKN